MENFKALPGTARVWIYPASRLLSEAEVTAMESRLNHFVGGWTAHQQQLMASGMVLHSLFVVIAVDESAAGASGCSIDKSMRFVRELERDFDVRLTDRLRFAAEPGGKLTPLTRAEFEGLISGGEITADTMVYDNLVATKQALETAWRLPLARTWMAEFFKLTASGEPASGKPASGEPASGKPASGKPASGKPASGLKN